ncbi:class I adenylate-forming enzyme family protein [Rhodococcus opacus]|uniref:class I adenylate-forming enzyme family protein n=1 Tax=Rhodococcus opacus TaxID=37919 RepID=UPI00223621D8|nr:AMP-binding protein [Rhodococcus opacus]UZG55544.1 AMP-binding protein [Rhodococcus opacus]
MSHIGYFAWDLATQRADAPCLRDDRLELTYRQFAERVDAFAAQLSENGVGRGDVVAIMLPNRAELLIALMASWRIGAAATPVNPTFTASEAEYQIDDATAVLVVNEGPDAPTGGRPAIAVGDMATTPDPAWAPGTTAGGDDLALLIYTSGSTGRPKGVMLTHDNLQFMSSSMVQHFSLTADDHCLLILPLFHVNAICVSFLTPMLAGGQLSVTGRFSPARFFDDVARLRPTYFSAVPTIYALLVSQDTVGDTSSLRFAVCGAAPISKELLDHAEQRFGLVIVEGYGLTEGTCASACNPPEGLRKPGTVGPALPGQTIAIVDESGAPVPAGAVGEVVIRGANVMRGYLGRPEETERTVIDGWLHTGDVGRLDEDGYLTLVDRIKDMIIRGGENIYPKEIENALATHDDVLEAAVIGAPHDVYGEVPVAYVVTYPDTAVTHDVLAEHLSSRLTKVKLPVAIHIVDALPRNPVGKIDKPGLRSRHRPAAVS